MIARAIVAVAPASAMEGRERLLDALSAAFPVEFVPFAAGDPAVDGVLAIGADALGDADLGVPALVVTDSAAGPARRAVRLGETPGLDRRLHGVTLAAQDLSAPIAVAGGDAILGTAGGDATWTRRPGLAPLDRVAAPLFDLAAAMPLRDAIHSARGLSVVALVSFLRAVSWRGEVVEPPVRAAILFDDPNLRRPTYGHIHFAELVRQADTYNYHASMAMIPLDRHLAHKGTVSLFRERADRVSLAFHGNNHEKDELLQPADLPQALVLCGQALRRMDAFERAEDLPVSRVMTAPHGMCGPPTARALGALPFDGLCAIHPLPWREDPPAERPLAGWDPATFVEGCPVLPRVPLDWGADGLALRGFLGHPIVLYGHHDDVAEGLGLLAEAAARINRMGDVAWSALGTMAEANARVHMAGATAVVQPFANRLRLTLPTSATQLTVAAPSEGGDGFTGWSRAGDEAILPFGATVARSADRPELLRLRSRWETRLASIAAPRPRPWPAVRRVGTELRDRLAPLRG